MGQVSLTTKQKNNTNNLMKFYKSINEKISLNVTIAVETPNDNIIFSNTKVVLYLGLPICYVTIKVEDDKNDEYYNLGLKNKYSIKDGTFICENYSDYQRKSHQLSITPSYARKTIHIGNIEADE